ncbi:MAG: flagellar assembly peptidoglycan hydrolase FlgJ [Thiobacillus sp.]|nr:flagellar assembly peptidoglycan hydrolase FlgJ [Thiobacillus sp.]MDP2056683.1 flagellar assembly peptidoglycan hydrolase FlgJ [Thiobacillus sp.]
MNGIGSADLTSKFALDVQGVNQLKLDAKQSSPEALKQAAQQFEAVFMNMLMKSMREATPQDGMFDSEQTRMYTSMLDQQLTQRMASRGIGLAEVMVRQLSSALNVPPPGEGIAPGAEAAAQGFPLEASQGFPLNAPQGDSDPLRAEARVESYAPGQVTAQPLPATPARSGDSPAHVEAFVQRLLPHAQAASASTGIPARFMLGQAALETGWGKAEIRGADGQNSHNLFGIKAGASWKGNTVDIVTTEYVNGKPQKQVESFRAYDSYADSFRDYANLLRGNARYQNVIAQGQDAVGFAQGLQQAGYATDPKYAQKLMSVIRQFDRA